VRYAGLFEGHTTRWLSEFARPGITLGVPQDFRFSGRSLLLDADGTRRGELGDEEALLVGTVTLHPALKKQTHPTKYSRYIYPGSPGREIIRLMEWRGSLLYTYSKLRKMKAVSVQLSG
jgi:hypothetical protein